MKSEAKVFNEMVLPNQAEGNPFFSFVDEVRREDDESPIKMKLEKARLF